MEIGARTATTGLAYDQGGRRAGLVAGIVIGVGLIVLNDRASAVLASESSGADVNVDYGRHGRRHATPDAAIDYLTRGRSSPPPNGIITRIYLPCLAGIGVAVQRFRRAGYRPHGRFSGPPSRSRLFIGNPGHVQRFVRL